MFVKFKPREKKKLLGRKFKQREKVGRKFRNLGLKKHFNYLYFREKILQMPLNERIYKSL